MTWTQWNTKKEKTQQDFMWVLGPETTHQITQSGKRIEKDNFKLDKSINLYKDTIYRKETNTTHEEIFGKNKQIPKHRKITGRKKSERRKNLIFRTLAPN